MSRALSPRSSPRNPPTKAQLIARHHNWALHQIMMMQAVMKHPIMQDKLDPVVQYSINESLKFSEQKLRANAPSTKHHPGKV